MSARWIMRIIGILMLLGFFLVFAYMQKRLVELQRTRPPATSTR
jgi:hypothetical protein